MSGKYLVAPGDLLYAKIRPRPQQSLYRSRQLSSECRHATPFQQPRVDSNEETFSISCSPNPGCSTYGGRVHEGGHAPRSIELPNCRLSTICSGPCGERAIAAFLDRETAEIDALIAKVHQAIGHLREFRTALISAAVTGKIDVREEAS